MKDLIKKWWNREWSNWECIQNLVHDNDELHAIILKRTSNHGLVQFKKVSV